jgi:hypothetical protein
MMTLLRRFATLAVLTLPLVAGLNQAGAQAAYTATGPGTYVSVGVTASGFQQDYGKHYIGGLTLFANANLTRRFGVEAEFRDLAAHTAEDAKERTYLAGARYSVLTHNWRPYLKLLAGRGELDFPFHYARGSYFVVAPGAGLDLRIPNTRLTFRAVDVEYQVWPQFTFGALHPYGVSTGLSFQVFAPSEGTRGRRFKH